MTTIRPTDRFSSGCTSARLSLLDPPVDGMQGAWWPRTRQLSSELSDLNSFLIGKHGLMHRITYAPTDWDEPEIGQCRATKAGSFVRLSISATLARHTLLIHTLHNTSIRLLVIPPSFDQIQARWALQLVLRSNGRCNAEEILGWCHAIRP